MKSQKFKIQELVPLKVYNLLHEDALWRIFDDKLLMSIDTIKEKFPKGSISINTWYWNGDRNQSGLRTKDSKYFSKGSQHSIGNAVDMVFSAYKTEDVRNYILEHQDEFPHITRIEKAGWLHVDIRPTDSDKIVMFDTNGVRVIY